MDNSSEQHDVFLSFRGEDTRNNFTSHLHDALLRANIKVFIDTKLDKGEVLTHALHRAIEIAKISVVVFSSDYASSSFCLEELVKILQCKHSKDQIVVPIFYKVNPSDLRKLKGTFEEAFKQHDAAVVKGKKRCRKDTNEEEMMVLGWKKALQEAGKLIGWHVKDNDCNEAEEIRKITQDISMKLKWESYSNKSKGKERMSIQLVGASTAVANLEQIWKYLMDDRISTVGIFGLGGVGKTTILTHIYNQLIRDANAFQHVFWVTVSKESNVYQLQSKIAAVIQLDLSREEDESIRGTELRDALNNMKKFVLILDDVWESFELQEVGIPTLTDERKLLLTTRKHGVCKRTKCDGIVKIEPLLQSEARDLFMRECGHQVDDNPELETTVEDVVKECGGLPLAIVAVARSTRGFSQIYEWRNILQELKKPFDRQNHDMEDKVFKLLKVSYDRLRNDKYRQGLHYCAMHPEDHEIDRGVLIEYWIGEELIDELDSRQEEYDMGNTIINELIDASLLLSWFDSDYVKMHDVVRDMVLSITRGKLMIKAGLQLQHFPKFTDWSANLEGSSIMCNDLEDCSFKLAPNCPKMRILLMQCNYELSELPNCFFVHMQNLAILDMRDLESLKSLPDSISKLEALRMLILEGCSSLEYIPSLAALKELSHLDLSFTNLENLPEGMEKLVNLRLLRIFNAREMCGLIPTEVLKELSLLQELSLQGTNVEVEPDAVRSLQKLEKLGLEFKNFDALNLYLESRHWERFESYFISNRNEEFVIKENEEIDDGKNDYGRIIYWCNDKDWECEGRKAESRDYVIPFNVEELFLMNFDGLLDAAMINGVVFAQLKKLTLKKCGIKYLINVDSAKHLFQNLQYLDLIDCPYIEEILGTEQCLNQRNHRKYPKILLPKLEKLCLWDLPRLRSIYRGNMELPSLEEVIIEECNELERLPFRELPINIWMYGSNIDSNLWWDSLQWDDQNHKQVFQKYFPKTVLCTLQPEGWIWY